MPTVDLRSDTVTHPTEEMLRAMVSAPLGDDVFGDDPTVRALEEEAAALVGKEAALFVPSGTMANSIAVAIATRPGDEIILMDDSHTYLFEGGGSARLWGVHARPLPGEDGCLDPVEVEGAIRPDDPHFPRTSMVLLENTHNMQGGIVVAPEEIARVAAVCRPHSLTLHLDGARLFNGVVALGRPATDFTAPADSVSVCLSKGLSCPVGSLLAGSAEAIGEARRVRKVLGGGMRQAGVLAACGRVALREGIERLADDHRRAAALARGLAALPGVRIFPDP
ncbi:MAG: threonine aldolase family protein, partial [Planctomycetota bacterium]